MLFPMERCGWRACHRTKCRNPKASTVYINIKIWWLVPFSVVYVFHRRYQICVVVLNLLMVQEITWMFHVGSLQYFKNCMTTVLAVHQTPLQPVVWLYWGFFFPGKIWYKMKFFFSQLEKQYWWKRMVMKLISVHK